MNFIFLNFIFYISLILQTYSYNHYIREMVCVFGTLDTRKTNNKLGCAVQCSSEKCPVFSYNKSTSNCSFYTLEKVCPSRNICPVKEVFINKNNPFNVRF